MYNNPATLHVAYTTLINDVASWKEFISKVTCINMSSVILEIRLLVVANEVDLLWIHSAETYVEYGTT